MALVTLSYYKTFVSYSASDRDTLYQQLIDECSDAVIQYLKNGSLEATSYTVCLPAPPRRNLVLPHFPILASSLVIKVNLEANGDVTAFTSDDLLTAGTGYVLETGPDNATYSRSGKVTLLNGTWSPGNWVRPMNALSARVEGTQGAVLATYTAGWATVPPSLQAAICLLVSRLYLLRKRGMLASSSSWNGASQSLQTPLALLQEDPTIRSMLKPFGRGIFVGGYAGAG